MIGPPALSVQLTWCQTLVGQLRHICLQLWSAGMMVCAACVDLVPVNHFFVHHKVYKTLARKAGQMQRMSKLEGCILMSSAGL